MIKGMYFLLLLAASAEDYRTHRVKPQMVLAVFVLGLINTMIQKENRWVTLALTCACFAVLLLFYQAVKQVAKLKKLSWKFGGADVRLIPGMMLVQGWDVALTGVFAGLILCLLYSVSGKKQRRELPLVPWMTAGCLIIEIFYLFSGKSVL